MILVLNMWVSYLADKSMFMILVFIPYGTLVYGTAWCNVFKEDGLPMETQAFSTTYM